MFLELTTECDGSVLVSVGQIVTIQPTVLQDKTNGTCVVTSDGAVVARESFHELSSILSAPTIHTNILMGDG